MSRVSFSSRRWTHSGGWRLTRIAGVRTTIYGVHLGRLSLYAKVAAVPA